MEKLAQFCKPSRNLIFSQILSLQKKCSLYNIKITFVHKFLIKFIINGEKAFLKINPYDGEFFYISKKYKLKIFSSFHQFRNWFEEEYLLGGE